MRCGTLLAAFVGVILAIVVRVRFSLEPDQVFVAVMSSHDEVLMPEAEHSRLRFHDFKLKPVDDYFQWWNYLIFDSVTRRHWTIAYGMTWTREDGIVGSCTVIERLDATDVVAGSMVTKLGPRFNITNAYDVVQRDTQGNFVFRQTVLDAGTYHIEGRTADINFDLTIKRVNGNFIGRDMIENQQNDCGVMSTYYGYHSVAAGSIRSRAKDTTAWKDYSIVHTKQFRAYAAGSFGCHLPFGIPPIEYPWYWFWLIIPNDDVNKDIAMAMGAGRMQDKLGPIDLEAGLSMIDVRDKQLHVSTRFGRTLYGTPFQTHLLGSASDGYLSNISVVVDNWVTFEDVMGKALVPLNHVYHVETKTLIMHVEFNIKPGQYFRIPFKHYSNVYSDFRAVGVDAKVFVKKKDTGAIIFDGWVHGMNAVEYAYASPFPPPKELLETFRPSISS